MQRPKTQTAAGHSPSAQAVWNEKKVRRILQELELGRTRKQALLAVAFSGQN